MSDTPHQTCTQTRQEQPATGPAQLFIVGEAAQLIRQEYCECSPSSVRRLIEELHITPARTVSGIRVLSLLDVQRIARELQRRQRERDRR